MSGKRSKRIRKFIFEDQSQRVRIYSRRTDGSVVNGGLRAYYLQAKAAYKAGR